MQKGKHQTIPQFKDQVPIGLQEGQTTIKEVEDHLQGKEAQLVHVMWLVAELLQWCNVSLSGLLGRNVPVGSLLPDFVLRIFRLPLLGYSVCFCWIFMLIFLIIE